jgi:hypothetical protein
MERLLIGALVALVLAICTFVLTMLAWSLVP